MPATMNSTANIVAIAEYVNASLGENVRPDVFYSTQLLDTIRYDESQYVYFRLAQESPIGNKADKLVLRRWTPLRGHIVPLAEGIPPTSDNGTVTKYEIDAKQYGRYMEFTDQVSFKMIDPIIAIYTKEYSLVVMETLDMLAREALLANCTRYFAGKCANFTAITTKVGTKYPDMTPTMTDLRLIVLAMKRALVKPRANGRFQVIGSAEFTFDMIDDPYVKAYMEYNKTTSTMYDDSVLCPMFGMEFYETLCCPTSGEFIDGSTHKCLQINTTTGALSVTSTSADNTAGYEKDTTNNMDTNYIPAGDHKVYTFTAGNEEYKVQHILIIGNQALIRTGLQGEDQAKMFVKPLGSTGVLDPIDQRQSIGFKINSVGFAVVESRAVTDYVCIPSTVNTIAAVAPA